MSNAPLILFMRNLAPTGGRERDVLKCIEALLAQNRELHIVVSFLHQNVHKLLSRDNVYWYRVPTLKRPPYLSLWHLGKRMQKLERDLKQRMPSAISLAFEWLPVGDYMIGGQPPKLWWSARQAMGLPLWNRPGQRLWEKWVQETLVRRGSHFVVYSELALKAFNALGVSNERISRVIIPTNLDRFRPTEVKDRRDILIIGSNPVLKGIDLALSAWREMHRQYPKLYLNIVGKGWKIERLVASADLPRVKLSPLIDHPEHYYQQARLLWAPSWFETWCNVVPEALASGLPVVTTNTTPSSEIICSPMMGKVIKRSSSTVEDINTLIKATQQLLSMPFTMEIMKLRSRTVREFQVSHLDLLEWIQTI